MERATRRGGRCVFCNNHPASVCAIFARATKKSVGVVKRRRLEKRLDHSVGVGANGDVRRFVIHAARSPRNKKTRRLSVANRKPERARLGGCVDRRRATPERRLSRYLIRIVFQSARVSPRQMQFSRFSRDVKRLFIFFVAKSRQKRGI